MTFSLDLMEFMYLQRLMAALITPAGTSSLTVTDSGVVRERWMDIRGGRGRGGYS